ncbi:MAG: hypothetical protein KJ043_08190 [Anaerolineae bacterium]|nr:hypothetical protein [Anaerolineae bacterium]
MPYFTVIGLCDTPEQAETIAEKLYGHIATIVQWHNNHPFKSEKLAGKPSPAELEIAQHYNLKWERLHDWLIVSMEDIEETVSVYDNLVFLTSGETNTPPQPFDALIKQFGVDVLVDTDKNRQGVTIQAKIATPNKIANAVSAYITQNGIAPCPWMVYMDGEKNADADKLLALDMIYCQHLTALETLEHHPNLIPLRGMPIYEKRYEALVSETFKGLPELNEEDADMIDDLREACAIIPNWDKLSNMPPYPTRISPQAGEITLKNVLFGEIASGLPAFLAWLEAEGATDISYELGE